MHACKSDQITQFRLDLRLHLLCGKAQPGDVLDVNARPFGTKKIYRRLDSESWCELLY